MTQSPFEKVTDSVYANADWSVVIDHSNARGWVVREYGIDKMSFEHLADAIEWAERWLRGETRVYR